MQVPWAIWVCDKIKLMSLVINGNGTVRAHLHDAQRVLYNDNTKGVAANVPTRFAGLHLVGCQLIRTKDAIVKICSDANVDTFFETCTNKDGFVATAMGTERFGEGHDVNFWLGAERFTELVQPVCDAIHQLEGDKPFLSQILAVWTKLCNHAAAFDVKYKLVGNQRTARVLRRRFAIHYQKEWAAAYALEPSNAIQGEDGGWSLPLALEELPRPTALNGDPLEFNFGPNNGQRVMKEDDVLSCVQELCGADKAAVEAELGVLELGGVTGGTVLARLMKIAAAKTTDEGGKVTLAPITHRRSWWSRAADKGFPLLARVAIKLLSCHITSCATERNWSLWGNVYVKARNRLQLERAKKLIGIRHNDAALVTQRVSDEEVTLTLLEA